MVAKISPRSRPSSSNSPRRKPTTPVVMKHGRGLIDGKTAQKLVQELLR